MTFRLHEEGADQEQGALDHRRQPGRSAVPSAEAHPVAVGAAADDAGSQEREDGLAEGDQHDREGQPEAHAHDLAAAQEGGEGGWLDAGGDVARASEVGAPVADQAQVAGGEEGQPERAELLRAEPAGQQDEGEELGALPDEPAGGVARTHAEPGGVVAVSSPPHRTAHPLLDRPAAIVSPE